MRENYVGWDIGGAHLKRARLDGKGRLRETRQVAMPLWRGLAELDTAIAQLSAIEGAAVHAITMTGELSDVFSSRHDGVRAILTRLASHLNRCDERRVYALTGWLDVETACARPLEVGSANWHALAACVAPHVTRATLVDVGSTTTDLLPLFDGHVAVRGVDDATRLACGELVYSGVVRTPLMAVCRAVPWQGGWQPLMAEHFATMADVHRLLGELRAQHDQAPSADGRDKSPAASRMRLARMLGMDAGNFAPSAWQQVAAYFAAAQRVQLKHALAQLASRDADVTRLLIGAGCGDFVVRRVAHELGAEYRALAQVLGSWVGASDEVGLAAPAIAVARLAWSVDCTGA